MIVVCEELQERLDKAWSKLQMLMQQDAAGSVSQYEADKICIEWLEREVTGIEKVLKKDY